MAKKEWHAFDPTPGAAVFLCRPAGSLARARSKIDSNREASGSPLVVREIPSPDLPLQTVIVLFETPGMRSAVAAIEPLPPLAPHGGARSGLKRNASGERSNA